MSKLYGHSAIGSSMMEVHRLNAPRSPSSSYQKRMVKTDSRTKTLFLQLPSTPEPQGTARNEVQILMENELVLPTEFSDKFD